MAGKSKWRPKPATSKAGKAKSAKRVRLVRDTAPAAGDGDEAVRLITEGAKLHNAGDLAGAEALYRRALELHPDHPHGLHFLGVIHHQNGDNRTAVELIEKAIAQISDYGDFHSNLGAAYLDMGEEEKAAESFSRAIELKPDSAEVHSNLATAQKRLGRTAEAIASYRRALDLNPDARKTLKYFGLLQTEREEFEEAAACFERYLKLVPEDGEVENNLGYAYERLSRLDEAERHYRAAARLVPDSVDIAYNLGNVLTRLGRAGEASAEYQRALAVDSGTSESMMKLAGSYVNQRRPELAEPIYRKLLDQMPDNARLYNDYGVTLAWMGKAAEAIEMINHAIELDPDFAEAYNNLATAQIGNKDRPAAIESMKEAIKRRPRFILPHIGLCVALLHEQRFDEAYLYGKALTMLEDYTPELAPNPQKIFLALCDFDGIEELGNMFDNVAGLKPADLSANFLEMLTIAETEEEVARVAGLHRRWGEDLSRRMNEMPLPPLEPRPKRDKIRLGFLSADLRSHSVAKFVLPLFKRYDRDAFEIYCYSPIDSPGDRVQDQIKGLVTEFRIVLNQSFHETAQVIRDDGVDILLELNGFTRDTKMNLMALRAAPVQIEWLGYPFTTGIPEVDYLLLDEYCKPAKEEWLVEKPLLMPESWVCFGDFPEEPISPEMPFERNGVFSFGTLNNPYKFTRKMVAAWCQVMHQVPDSRFIVVRPECRSSVFCTNLAREFEKNGIPPDRLYFVNNRAMGMSHLTFYDEIDMSMDTFPVTGGTTTCDALWMGVPVVALYGPSVHHRMCYSLLNNAGLCDLCADTVEEYIQKSVDLANNRELLTYIRHVMRPTLLESPLCQAERFTENFQNLMQETAARHGLR